MVPCRLFMIPAVCTILLNTFQKTVKAVTDLFSATPTLAEEMGYEELNEEVQKYSQYFIDHFAK